jgi:hypothetical protein
VGSFVLAGSVSVRAFAASPQPIASALFVNVRMSANGEWLLVTRISLRESARFPLTGKLYLSRRGHAGLRLVGGGGQGLAVSDDGRSFAYQCGVKTTCIKHLDNRSVRRFSMPCPGSAPASMLVSDRLNTIITNCEGARLRAKILRIGSGPTKVTTLAPPLIPAALSSDGATAIFNGLGGSTYIYRNGHLRRNKFLFRAMSRNGRFIVATGSVTATFPCGSGCVEHPPLPVLIDTQTGLTRNLPFTQTKGIWGKVSDNGKTVLDTVFRNEQHVFAQEALELTNTETGAHTILATPTFPGDIGSFDLSADATIGCYVLEQGGNGKPHVATLFVFSPTA